MIDIDINKTRERAAANGGNIKLAIAESLYGEEVVKDCLGIPAFANLAQIESIEVHIKSLNKEAEKNQKIEKIEKTDSVEEIKDDEVKTDFSVDELLEILTKSNRGDTSINEQVALAIYGERAIKNGELTEIVNIRQVAFVKGKITQLLNSLKDAVSIATEKADPVEQVEQVEKVETV